MLRKGHVGHEVGSAEAHDGGLGFFYHITF